MGLSALMLVAFLVRYYSISNFTFGPEKIKTSYGYNKEHRTQGQEFPDKWEGKPKRCPISLECLHSICQLLTGNTACPVFIAQETG